MHISHTQALALRKLAGAKLTKAGFAADLDGFDATALVDSRAAHGAKKSLTRVARDLIDALPKDANEARSAEYEEAHDALMSAVDDIEQRLDELSGKSKRPHYADVTIGGDAEPAEAFALRSGETFEARSRANGQSEHAKLSTGAYLRAMVLGAKNAEERAALAEGSDSTGGYTVPEILSARLIDKLRAASVVMKAGAQSVPLLSDTNYIARVATDPVPAWRSEAGAVTESEPTFDRVTLTPRSLAVLVKASREILEDSVNIETALPRILANALALELDRVAMFGTGTAPQPKGIANFGSGLTANTFAGGELVSYSPLVKARTALRMANSDVTAYVMSPREEGYLADMVDTTGQPLQVPRAIADIPFLATTAVATDGGSGENESKLIAGDWRRLLIGIRSDIRIEVLKERYADTMQFGFIAHLRADVAAEHNAAFTVLSGITPETESGS